MDVSNAHSINILELNGPEPAPASKLGPEGGQATEADSTPPKNNDCTELTISQLYKQRDALISQLAEARASKPCFAIFSDGF